MYAGYLSSSFAFRHHKMAHFLWQLFADDRQRRRTMRDHENSPPGWQHMADDVRDRVRFSSPWWSLDHQAIRLFEATDNFNLFIVKGLWKEKIAVVRIDGFLVKFDSQSIGSC